LTSPRFLTAEDTPEPTLEACYEDRARLAMGARGEPVEMVQQALIDLGYDLGDRGADGAFGQKTAQAVKDFKADEQLGFEWIGDVGPGTMHRLDELFPPDLPVCPVGPVPDVVVAAADVAPAVPAEATVAMLARDARPEREQRCNPRRHRDPPLPPGACPPAPSTPGVCGPDVTAEVKRAWTKARSDFFKLPSAKQDQNCTMLVSPVVTDPATGKLTLNADAFDTWGLFQGSAHWTRIPPWHGPCGTPGTTSTDNCDEFDPLHECDTVCSNTVQIGNECWVSGTVNYGLFGVLMRSCFDHYFLLAPFSPSAALKVPLFSLASTMSLVGAYKALKGDSIVGPERWAAKTWVLGPGALATGGNRPNCAPTCPGPAPPTFLVVWEPNMTRLGMPADLPYMCP
jgi:hypothetical protein